MSNSPATTASTGQKRRTTDKRTIIGARAARVCEIWLDSASNTEATCLRESSVVSEMLFKISLLDATFAAITILSEWVFLPLIPGHIIFASSEYTSLRAG